MSVSKKILLNLKNNAQKPPEQRDDVPLHFPRRQFLFLCPCFPLSLYTIPLHARSLAKFRTRVKKTGFPPARAR